MRRAGRPPARRPPRRQRQASMNRTCASESAGLDGSTRRGFATAGGWRAINGFEQRQRKSRVLVDPLIGHRKPAAAPEIAQRLGRVFVGALRPDRLAGGERDAHIRGRSSARPAGALLTRCISMRCSRRSRPPDARTREIEVGAQLAVDPDEQVLVERRGDAERIVVGQQQVLFRLDEIGAEQQQRRPAPAARRIALEKRSAAGGSKLPMFDPRKTTSVPGATADERPQRREPGLVGATGEPTTRHWSKPAEPRLGRARGPARDVDQMHARGRLCGSAAISSASFSPLPQPSSTSADRVPAREHGPRHVARVRAQQPGLGARDAVPRQPADRVEQARPERIVEISRLQLFRLARRSRTTSAANASSERWDRRITGTV